MTAITEHQKDMQLNFSELLRGMLANHTGKPLNKQQIANEVKTLLETHFPYPKEASFLCNMDNGDCVELRMKPISNE